MTHKTQTLNKISQAISICQACPLFQKATNPVPGQGNPDAKVVFIGEGPGSSEDQKGIPFCGRSGQLLDRLLQAINLSRSEVFITNIVKHRPPGNRDPLPGEIIACTPFLRNQLLAIRPRIIVTLGRFALNYFSPTDYISQVHGQIKKLSWESLDLSLMPLYHPAAGLRNGTVLKDIKKDFVKLGLFLKTIRLKPST